jgi:hypothetical protein
VFDILQLLMPVKLLTFLIKPIVRLILGLVSVPLFKIFLHRVVRVKDLNEELEKDISQWILGSLQLLVATANMESLFFVWVPPEFREDKVWIVALRLLLAIGVIEKMPDQALFSIIHPGPPPLKIHKGRVFRSLIDYIKPCCIGLLCTHFNRSSPVLAILTVFVQGPIGWIFYGLAITNYLIIGLVSSRDKALNVLQQFDQAVAERREELKEELIADGIEPLSPEQRIAAAESAGPFPAPVQSPSQAEAKRP